MAPFLWLVLPLFHYELTRENSEVLEEDRITMLILWKSNKLRIPQLLLDLLPEIDESKISQFVVPEAGRQWIEV